MRSTYRRVINLILWIKFEWMQALLDSKVTEIHVTSDSSAEIV